MLFLLNLVFSNFLSTNFLYTKKFRRTCQVKMLNRSSISIRMNFLFLDRKKKLLMTKKRKLHLTIEWFVLNSEDSVWNWDKQQFSFLIISLECETDGSRVAVSVFS